MPFKFSESNGGITLIGLNKMFVSFTFVKYLSIDSSIRFIWILKIFYESVLKLNDSEIRIDLALCNRPEICSADC